MFYFKFHIGDYRRETQHLTLLEHGVYMTLMSTYYTNEKPLPKDERQLLRLAGARTEEEKQAVIDVVNEFFIPTETHWVHSRIDFELKEYQEKAEKNRENGKKGGRPRKNQENNPSGYDSLSMETQTDSEIKPKHNPNITLTNKPINPLTNNIQDKPEKFVFKKALIDLGVDSKLVDDWLIVRKNKKASNTETALKGFLGKVEKSGIDLNTVLKICVERSWTGFDKSWLENINISDYQEQKSFEQKLEDSPKVQFKPKLKNYLDM